MTNQEIIIRGELIRDETVTGANTAQRVGEAFVAIGENLSEVEESTESLKSQVRKKVDEDSNSESFIKDASECDVIVDAQGNVVAKIGELDEGKKGVQASDFYDKEGNSINNKLAAAEESIVEVSEQVDGKLPKDSTDEQVISDGGEAERWVDKDGNIGMELTKDGKLRVNEIEVQKGNSNGALPLDSNEPQIVKDGSDEEVWADKYGFVGAKLTKEGKFKANIDDGTLENEFILPKYIYCMNGVQRNFWHQAILKRWNPYDFYLQFEGNAKYQRRTPLVATVKEGNSDGYKLTIKLIDNRKMKIIQTGTSLLRVSTPAAENDGLPILRVSFIGSSTTQSAYFKEAFTRYVSYFELIGIRHAPNEPTIKHEGRGGTTLALHFGEGNGVSEDPLYHFMPFWQPNDVSANETYRYWGATGFWILAHTHPDNESQDENENGAYENGCYNPEVLAKFDSTTGFLINPTQGDIMYDNTNSRYVLYDGSQWIPTTRETYNWSFQYAKYLSMWGLETPDVVSICLGTNDFKNVEVANMEKEIGKWNILMDTLITDIHTNVDPNIKIVLCNQGHFSNYGKSGIPTALWNYKMWLHLKDLVKVYDKRESENIYVLAQGSEISAEYGFPTIMTDKNTWPGQSINQDSVTATFPYTNWPLVFPTELYHEIYNNNDYPRTVIVDGEGKIVHASVPEEKMKVVNTDVVHSTLSYPNQGVPMAAFCQYIRQHSNND